MQRQKRHDATNDIKVNFLICRFVGCMKKHAISCRDTFFIIRSMRAMEFAENLTLIYFCLEFA